MRVFDYRPESAFALKQRWHTPCYNNLGKLHWVGGFGVVCHGVKLGVRVSDESLVALLQDRLPPSAKPLTSDRYDAVMSVIRGGQQPGSRLRKFHLVYQNHTQVGRSHRLEEVLERFDSYFALTVAMLAPRKVFVHAGAVAWKGQAIVVPGATLAGKSTLVMELVKAGATYLSDEFAILENGRVHPWPKPISMRETRTARQVDVPVETVGGHVGTRSYPIGLVLDTTFEDGARWQPRTLSPGEGVLKLLANCPAARIAPRTVMRGLERAATNAAFVSSLRGEAGDLVPQVLEAAERHATTRMDRSNDPLAPSNMVSGVGDVREFNGIQAKGAQDAPRRARA